jgi:hypothetical protein
MNPDDGQSMDFAFDCNGHFVPGFNGQWRNVPSRSVAGKIAQIACARTRP